MWLLLIWCFVDHVFFKFFLEFFFLFYFLFLLYFIFLKKTGYINKNKIIWIYTNIFLGRLTVIFTHVINYIYILIKLENTLKLYLFYHL